MSRRMICIMICVVLLLPLARGTHVQAAADYDIHTAVHARPHRQSPLVPAMLLVLAGFAVTLLFDKRE